MIIDTLQPPTSIIAATSQPRQATTFRSSMTLLGLLAVLSFSLGGLSGCGGRRTNQLRTVRFTAEGTQFITFRDRLFGGSAVLSEHGSPSAPVVLLVHGVGQKAPQDWAAVQRSLAKNYRVLTVHLPGFGRSSHGNKLYSPWRYARWLREVVVAIAKQPVRLIGHSMGGAVCLRFAAAYPELVRSLVLVDVAGVLHRQAFVEHMLRRQLGRMSGYGRWFVPMLQRRGEQLLKASDALGFDPAVVLRSSAGRLAFLGANPSRIAGLALMVDDLGPSLDKITARTLLVWGSVDPIAPLRTGYLLRARLKNARLTQIIGAHHVPMRERPVEFLAILSRFFAGKSREKPIVATTTTNTVTATSAPKIARCDGRAKQVIEGVYDKIIAKDCPGLLIRNARTKSIVLDNCSARLRDVVVAPATGIVGLISLQSRLLITGGSLGGAVHMSHGRMDLAGVRLSDRRAFQCRVGPCPVIISTSTVTSPATESRHYLHGYWRLKTGAVLP